MSQKFEFLISNSTPCFCSHLLNCGRADVVTPQAFLFGRWVKDARSWARGSEEEANLYEFNARNQVTLWGPKVVDNNSVWGYNNDYAAKNWQGLVSGYYLPRWQLFMQYAQDALQASREFATAEYIQADMDLGVAFCEDTKTNFPSVPEGDTVATSALLQAKYGNDYLVSAKSFVYVTMENSSVEGLNIVEEPAWTSNLAQLQLLCDIDPGCQAFTSEGYFKLSSALDKIVPAQGVTLYVKQANK